MAEFDDGPPGSTWGSDQERRDAKRVKTQLRVALRFGTIAEALRSETLNVSRGGAFIRTDEKIGVGLILGLDVQIGMRVLSLRGRVVRVVEPGTDQPPGIGVLFTDVDDEARFLLDSLVAAGDLL